MSESEPSVIGGLQRVGLGYLWEDAIAGMRWSVSRLHDRWDGLHGELEVRRLYPAGPEGGFRLYRGRVNLSSSSDRDSKARYLAGMIEGTEAGLDRVWWLRAVGGFCERVLDAHRAGAPFVRLLDRDDAEPGLMLDPVVWCASPTTIFGAGGSAKTTLGIAALISVETGHEVVPGWRPEVTAPTLALDWEAHERIWRSQVLAICRGAGIDPPNFAYRPMAGALADDVEEIAAYVTRQAIGLVLIDSVEPASSGAEADDYNRRAERLFDAVRCLNTAGCAALLIDHVRGDELGAGGQPIQKAIGGVRKRDRSRGLWEVRAETDPDPADRVEVALRDTKRNLSVRRPSMGVAIQFDDLDAHGRARRITFSRTEITAPELAAAAMSQPERILRVLKGGAATAKAIAEETGLAENAVRSNLSRLVKKGRVVGLPDGTWGLLQP